MQSSSTHAQPDKAHFSEITPQKFKVVRRKRHASQINSTALDNIKPLKMISAYQTANLNS